MILKKTTVADLDTLFEFQTDNESNRMAAFTAENPNDRAAYMAKWTKIVDNPEVNMQTIFIDNTIVGSVLHFDMMNETNVSYWVGREHWGKGIATKALKLFLGTVEKRPLYGRVAFDNHGSRKVLEKCGFVYYGKATEYANGRNEKIEEFILILEK